MKFRSLFAKIFLWFWLSITVVIASLALVTWLYPYSAMPSGSLPDRLHELQVRGAIAVLELKGNDAFEQHRRQLDSASRLRTYYLDDQGIELSGQTVPDRLLIFAKEHQEQINDGERVMVGEPSRLAIPITGANGRKYLALVESSRTSAAPPPGGPGRIPGGPMRGGDRGPESQPDDSRDSSREPDRRPPPPFDGERRGAGGPGGPGGGPPPRGRGPGGPPPVLTPRFELLVPTHVLLLRLLAVVLVAGIGCFLLARYLTSPVRRLQHAARQLAEGDFAARAGPKLASRRDEIGELGRDFDRMADRIESLLTAQKRLLQDVSHELRSPLARLNVALELAARDAGPAATPALQRVGLEAQRLNDLIGQLLTLVRLERGSAQPSMRPLDLCTLVEDVAADAEFEASARNRHVRIVRCDDCRVNGTSDLLRSAIENIMRNAAQYTSEGSAVEVSLTVSPESNPALEGHPLATLEIRDFGPGVPDEALARIFQPFYRVSDARERVTGGTGLGLAIAERAIRLHGGTVEAVNASGHKSSGGLVVRIRLPLA